MDNGQALSIAAQFDRAVMRYPDREALIEGEQRLTYRALNERIEHCALQLTQRGVGRGDRIVALVGDGTPFILLFLAAARLGATLCPLNWRLSPSEMRHQITVLEPSIAVYSQDFAEKVPLDAMPWTAFEDFGAISGDTVHSANTVIDARPDDVLLILFTSGTTGQPKGAMHSQAGLAAGAISFARHRSITQEDRTLLSAPLFHVNGLSSALITLLSGAALIVAPQKLDAENLERILLEERCTVWNFHPTLAHEIIARAKLHQRKFFLRSISMGASLHSVETVQAMRSSLCDGLIFGYGQTEAGGFALVSTAEEQATAPTSWGHPLDHLEARILDDAGQPVPRGSVGELALRGTSIMLGYWRQPRETAMALAGGWLRTGDMCLENDDGLICFAGRKKELVKSGGENVYPAEVERVLMAHPAVLDCCIVGIPDVRWGEAVKAFVVLAPECVPSRQALTAWCRDHIASYKRPRYIEFIEEIPRDFQKKPQRSLLAARPVTADQSTDAPKPEV